MEDLLEREQKFKEEKYVYESMQPLTYEEKEFIKEKNLENCSIKDKLFNLYELRYEENWINGEGNINHEYIEKLETIISKFDYMKEKKNNINGLYRSKIQA
ncbi:hypothetical protein ACFO6R_06445 [Eubacterium multiforme]|uniref:Uncharacterized protein n=1 Tax=Eubacterium multiforme TaxID=83339 RepID=A0ABT9USE5_9FIRM|nr:hypothetical protein [Eubacterium multiforme]MDQ0149233.1 hypothetical protein [Eubacterium multiforme]